MDAIIDKRKAEEKQKGFPLLNIKMRYEWYRKSNKAKVASVTLLTHLLKFWMLGQTP